ncbi:histidine kinase [Clostridium acetobutylicum]|nr:histidine kinase [Clostridium acetobutylicum]
MDYSKIEDFHVNIKKDQRNKIIFLLILFCMYCFTQILFLNYEFYAKTSNVFKMIFDLGILISSIITYKFSGRKSIGHTRFGFAIVVIMDFISLVVTLRYGSFSREIYRFIRCSEGMQSFVIYTYIVGIVFRNVDDENRDKYVKFVEIISFVSLTLLMISLVLVEKVFTYKVITIYKFNIFCVCICLLITLIFIYNLYSRMKYIKDNGLIKWYVLVYLAVIIPNVLALSSTFMELRPFMEFISSFIIYITVSEKVINKTINNAKAEFYSLKRDKLSYRGVLEKLKDGVIIKNEDKVVFMNEAQRKMFGLTKDKTVEGIDINKIVHRCCCKAKNNEKKIITAGGKELYLEVEAFGITINGERLTLDIVKDVSDEILVKKSKEEIEKVKKTDKLKGEFFTNITHELRTPINVIYSALQVMEMRIDKNNFDRRNLNKYMKVLKQNCYRLLRIISNLIDITKIDTGFLKPCVSNREIIGLIENITMSIVPYLHEKGMELVFDTDVEEKYVQCDPDMVERIMLNLLSNAVKFRKEKGLVLVTIHDKGSRIVLKVKDNGIGIPKEKQKMIFKRFKQINPLHVTPHQGSGIGLSLVKSIVEMNGGKISVESEENVGTTFIIEFPAIQNEIMEEYKQVKKVDDNSIKNIVEKVNIEFADIYLE